MTKRITALIAALVLVFCLAACGETGSEEGGVSAPEKNETVVPPEKAETIAPPPKETEPPAPTITDSGSLGDFDVTIGEIEIIQDYSGKPAALIHYTFTNNSDKNESAAFNVSLVAFQNGVSLETAVIMNDSIHDAQATMKDVQPGATIEITEAFSLTSETAPVVCYMSETFFAASGYLGKAYEIAPGGETIPSTAPTVGEVFSVGSAAVSLNSYDIVTGRDGEQILVLNMGYTNNSNTYRPFYTTVTVQAFQNGIELETAYSIDLFDADQKDMDNRGLSLLPGVGIGVSEAFILTSSTDPIDIEITEYISFNGEPIKTQIDPTQ